MENTKKMKNLTDKQLRVWNALKEWIAKNDLVPTHQELAGVLGVARTTITIHLASLERKGYNRRTRCWRDLEVVTPESKDHAKSVDDSNKRYDQIMQRLDKILDIRGGVK